MNYDAFPTFMLNVLWVFIIFVGAIGGFNWIHYRIMDYGTEKQKTAWGIFLSCCVIVVLLFIAAEMTFEVKRTFIPIPSASSTI